MKEKQIPNRNKWGLEYYCEEVGWRDSSFVVMEKPDDIPEPLRKLFSFTNKHERLLKWLRGELEEEGKPKIKIRDALNLLSDVEVEDYAVMWEFVKKRRNEIDEKIKREFSVKKVFLYDDELYPPIRILIPPRGGAGLKHTGRIGEWLSLDSNRSREEEDALLALGALEFDKIFTKKDMLLDLLANFLQEKLRPGSNLWSDYISIVSKMIDLNITTPSDLSFVPIRRDEGITFKPPKKVLFKDDSGIWELFKDEERLCFFDPYLLSNKDEFVAKVREWLGKCGAWDLKRVLSIVDEPELANAQHESALRENLMDTIELLSEIVNTEFEERDLPQITQKIDELKTTDIYSCENITRGYSIDMTYIDGSLAIAKEIIANQDYYFDKHRNIIFLRKGLLDSMTEIEEVVKKAFYPGFEDKYRKRFWEEAVELAFFQGEITTPTRPPSPLPDIDINIRKLNDWWQEYLSNSDRLSFPTLDGAFWWPALGLDDDGNRDKREDILRERLISKDRKLWFNILSMATLLGTNVGRTQIKNFLEILNRKGLSFSEMYEMREEEVLRQMIDDMFKDIDSRLLLEKDYPQLRRRIFDILVLRRAMKDEMIGENILDTINTLMADGLSPEEFFSTGRAYASRPFMKGFKGMFTGQIYFIVREMVRLGIKDNWRSIRANKWQDIAFHAPSQVRTLISNIGGRTTSGDDWREKLARDMIRKTEDHEVLSGWYDIPFFIYCDEFCRGCWRGNPPPDCKMVCYQRWGMKW